MASLLAEIIQLEAEVRALEAELGSCADFLEIPPAPAPGIADSQNHAFSAVVDTPSEHTIDPAITDAATSPAESCALSLPLRGEEAISQEEAESMLLYFAVLRSATVENLSFLQSTILEEVPPLEVGVLLISNWPADTPAVLPNLVDSACPLFYFSLAQQKELLSLELERNPASEMSAVVVTNEEALNSVVEPAVHSIPSAVIFDGEVAVQPSSGQASPPLADATAADSCVSMETIETVPAVKIPSDEDAPALLLAPVSVPEEALITAAAEVEDLPASLDSACLECSALNASSIESFAPCADEETVAVTEASPEMVSYIFRLLHVILSQNT